MVIYEALPPSGGGGAMVQLLVVRVDIGILTYEAMTPHCWGLGLGCQSG